jgi:hypothetical protein
LPLTESRADALALLARAAERSRRSNAAYSREFVRAVITVPDIPTATPPLARLIQGGRGGEARLKLYLLLTMIATRQPFDIRNPPTPRTLARTLDLAATTGARRITSNMKWLADKGFIELTKRPGLTSAIQLLDPQGTGKPLPDPRRQAPYVTVPIGFWSHGWLLHLSPVAIAVMFSLRELLGGYTKSRYVLRDRRESYGLSHDTWTRGRHELEDVGLLTVTRVPQGDEYVHNRLRNSYWLNIDLLDAAVPI